MDRLLIGRVWRPHGVRGELKVIPETDDPERFGALERVFLGTSPEAAREYRVQSVRFQPSKRGVTVVLKIEGIATFEDAEAVRHQDVYAEEEDLPPLGEDEIFLHDLIGLDVVTDAGEPVGTVADVLVMPAHNVYVVSREGGDEAMIPAVPEFVLGIDLEAGKLVVRPIEGMLE